MKAEDIARELHAVAEEMRRVAASGTAENVTQPLLAYENAANRVGQSWSESNLGYHARVYYAGFQPPPPGAFWSSEWGSEGIFSQASRGEWQEFDRATILQAIDHLVKGANLDAARAAAARANTAFDGARSSVVSLIVTALKQRDDEYLRGLKGEVEKSAPLTERQGITLLMPHSGSIMSRDSRAITAGLESAVHQEVLASVVAVRSTFNACEQLATLADRAATHVARVPGSRDKGPQAPGDRVFIGHGRSPVWRELKDFVQDRLELPWDEFNRVPVAGITNIARLEQMLDDAGVGFIILTAEDELIDGAVVARQNVVHEAGLFQGRLGFTRAIVMLEEGCEQFSNIEGLGQIRFPKGNIAAKFEEVRRVLEREGLVGADH